MTSSGFSLHPFPSREKMAGAAGSAIAQSLREKLDRKERVRVVFASASSQADTLAALNAQEGIDWHRIAAFHMDEYIGLDPAHPSRFGVWLKRHLFDRHEFAEVNLIEPGANPEVAAREYGKMLTAAPIDLVCLGIGVNGHIAFNDPPVADFADPEVAKCVTLDRTCRLQQVEDGAFERFEDVPVRAITLTVPTLMSADTLIGSVPGKSKRAALLKALEAPVTTACPASILKTHNDCALFVDPDAYPVSE